MSVESPTRLAFLITDLDPGGAERSLVELVTRLDRSRWEPHVFCLSRPGKLVEPLQQAGIPVTCYGARGVRDVTVVFRLIRDLRRLKPSLLQSFLFHANITGRIAGCISGVRRIVSGIRVAEKRSRFPLWCDRWTNRLVDHNVCVSRGVAEFSIQSGLKPETVSVIPNGVDAERFAHAAPADLQEFGIAPQSPTVICVGRLDRQKNPQSLLEAVALREELARLHVLFVGDGPLRDDLSQFAASHGLRDRVHFAGWQPHVPALLKAADYFVLPSLWEGMPNAVLEAMAASLPVVVSDVEGIRELLQHQHSGIVVSPDSPSELAEALVSLMTSPETAREIARNAQNIATKHFTINSVVAKYDSLYRRLLKM